MNTDLLRIDNLSYTYPDAAEPALANLSFAVGAGECLCLTGRPLPISMRLRVPCPADCRRR